MPDREICGDSVNRFCRLAFASEALQLTWFRLSANGLVAADKDETIDDKVDNILVLPALAGLPFQISLPFGDCDKISRVIPQFVADIYSEVDENWCFTWNLSEAPSSDGAPSWKVSGLAFPAEFAPERLAPALSWRLAIPDTALLAPEAASAFRLISPVHEFVAVFSDKNSVSRIIRDATIPLRPVLSAAGIEELCEANLSSTPENLFKRVDELLNNAGSIDLSGWQRREKARALRWAVAGALSLIVGLIFAAHLMLWYECQLYERAAERTFGHVSSAFTGVFPGVPMIDAVSQLRRRISETAGRLKDAGSLPDLRWSDMMALTTGAVEHKLRMLKLIGRIDGFRLHGIAANFTSLDAFRRSLSEDVRVETVSMPESRKSGAEVLFVLEVVWKQ